MNSLASITTFWIKYRLTRLCFKGKLSVERFNIQKIHYLEGSNQHNKFTISNLPLYV